MEPPSTASGKPSAERVHATAMNMWPWALPAAIAVAAATLVRHGVSANGVVWALVQVVLVGIAAHDFATRRIKNVVTVPVAVLAVLFRVAFDRGAVVEVVVAGAVAFAAFLVLAIVLRGGLGMGDVKLAAMLGFLLGAEVVPALVVGVVAGGLAAAAVVARGRGRGATMAYGPYLALGGMLVVLLGHPPRLV
jgi:leader peptidase (prepilin peptidase) / N-methyltransferase